MIILVLVVTHTAVLVIGAWLQWAFGCYQIDLNPPDKPSGRR